LNYRGVEVDYLPLVHVIGEMHEWLELSTDWSTWWAQQPRASLSAELLVGLANVGPSVRREARGAVENAEAATSAWQAATSATANRLSQAVTASVAVLRSSLVSVAGLGAAWIDLAECHESGMRNWRRRERVLDFVELSIAVGHNPPWFTADLAGLINDEAHVVGALRESVHGTPYEIGTTGPAGSTMEELEELLTHSISRRPLFGECVVWLDFVDADLGDRDHVDAGNVQYWATPRLIELVRDPTVQLPPPLDEVREHGVPMVGLPDAGGVPGHSVWARVELGQRHVPRAVEDAHAAAMLLADLAAVRTGGPRWRRGGWVAVLVDGVTVSSGRTNDPGQFPPFPEHMRRVGCHLAELAESSTPTSAPRAELGLIAQLWAEVEEHQGPKDRVPAVVRVVDSLLDGGGKNSSLRSTLPRVVAWRQQSGCFSNPILAAVQALALEAGMYQGIPEQYARALPSWPRVMNYELIPLLPTLVAELSGTAERFAADIGNSQRLVDDGEERRSDTADLVARHALGWQRAIRFRNAVTHGSPAPHETGAIAAKTADTVGLAVIDSALAAAHSGRSIPSELQRAAQWAAVPGWARDPR
jgi:hypothetical protein